MEGKPVLGRLERIRDIREYWAGEALDFTPWLASADNITLLSEAIDIDLEVIGQERNVGPFRADILCKDTLSGHYVLIENQLERTDHLHLGQLLTYAAGLNAVSIVWVSPRFTDEHRAALDWLNRMTVESVNFFGLEIELWQIADSPVAPKFNVVSQPNDWAGTVAQQVAADTIGVLTDKQRLHLEYWTQFQCFMEERESPIRVPKPSKDSWISISVGKSYFALIVTNGMRDGFSQLHLAISGPQAKTYFHQIHEQHHDPIEGVLGPLDWREPPNAKESQIVLRRSTTPTDQLTWPELNDWFSGAIESWVEVFRPIVRSLQPEEPKMTEAAELDEPT